MSSPPNDGEPAHGKGLGQESISSKFRAVNFETPGSGDMSLGTPDYNVIFETPDSNAIGQMLHPKDTPHTLAPKLTRIQRERERAARLSQQSSRLLGSSDSRTTGGDTIGDIILHLNANAEDMNSSMIRGNSKGRILRPTEDDDIFTAPPAHGKSLDWMHRRRARNSPTDTTPLKPENNTPTKDPRKKYSSKGPPKMKSPEMAPPKKKELGIPFPNFGRFWCAKFNWEELQGAFVVKMFEQCDPEDEERVKELYELAWVIKVSTAMVQCDIQDQTRVQQLVQWAQDLRSENDWQCPTPLGWNSKQQQYAGPRPSDEERQRFVDYAWQMNQNKVRETRDDVRKRKYDEAALEVLTFKNKYPEFPHDYPPGYPGEHPNYTSKSLYSGEKVGAVQRSRDANRKAAAADTIQEPLKKRKAATAEEDTPHELLTKKRRVATAEEDTPHELPTKKRKVATAEEDTPQEPLKKKSKISTRKLISKRKGATTDVAKTVRPLPKEALY